MAKITSNPRYRQESYTNNPGFKTKFKITKQQPWAEQRKLTFYSRRKSAKVDCAWSIRKKRKQYFCVVKQPCEVEDSKKTWLTLVP